MPVSRGGARGSALAELIISILIIAFGISALSGVMFSTSLRSGTSQDKELAVRHVDLLLQDLRNYVTADTAAIPEAPGSPAWHLPTDSSCADCWALAPGTHDATARLPASFRAAPRNARLTYTVTEVVRNGETLSSVTAALTWDKARQ